MKDLPQVEEEMHPSKGDDTEIAAQEPAQEAETEAMAPTSSSSIIWKASVRSLEGVEQDSFKRNTALAAEECEDEV